MEQQDGGALPVGEHPHPATGLSELDEELLDVQAEAREQLALGRDDALLEFVGGSGRHGVSFRRFPAPGARGAVARPASQARTVRSSSRLKP